MKTTSAFPLILFLWVTFPQNTHAYDYYPLALGNEWFYRSIGLPSSDSTIGGSVKVIGDSLFSNGHLYFVLNGNDIMGSRFVRTDSTSVFYLNPYSGQDQRVFRLNSQVGDTTQLNWGPYAFTRLAEIDTVIVFGQPLRILTFQLDGILYAVIRLCEKFGPMTEWRYSDPPPPFPEWGRELVGCAIDGVRYGHTLDVSDQSILPEYFQLYQNFPNPFNPNTTIHYQITTRSLVRLKVFDVLGREVVNLVNDILEPGYKSVRWDASNITSGVYFYQLQAGMFVETKKMILMK